MLEKYKREFLSILIKDLAENHNIFGIYYSTDHNRYPKYLGLFLKKLCSKLISNFGDLKKVIDFLNKKLGEKDIIVKSIALYCLLYLYENYKIEIGVDYKIYCKIFADFIYNLAYNLSKKGRIDLILNLYRSLYEEKMNLDYAFLSGVIKSKNKEAELLAFLIFKLSEDIKLLRFLEKIADDIKDIRIDIFLKLLNKYKNEVKYERIKFEILQRKNPILALLFLLTMEPNPNIIFRSFSTEFIFRNIEKKNCIIIC